MKKRYNDIICGFSFSNYSKLLRLYREEVMLLERKKCFEECAAMTLPLFLVCLLFFYLFIFDSTQPQLMTTSSLTLRIAQ